MCTRHISFRLTVDDSQMQRFVSTEGAESHVVDEEGSDCWADKAGFPSPLGKTYGPSAGREVRRLNALFWHFKIELLPVWRGRVRGQEFASGDGGGLAQDQ